VWPADHRGAGMLSRGWVWAILALTLAAGAGACGSGAGTAATSAASSTSAASLTSKAHTEKASGSLPTYEPSKVVIKVGGFVRLRSADSVSKVSSFYRKALKSGDWRIVSIAGTAARTSIVAMHGTTGVTIGISSSGAARTSISVLRCTCGLSAPS
jgi:plastocyanin